MYISSRVCKNCGKVFTPKRKHGAYCKESCRIADYKKRHGIPTPDFSLISKTKIATKEQINQAEIQSHLRTLLGQYTVLENQEKPLLVQEQAYEKEMQRKREYDEKRARGEFTYSYVGDYDIKRAVERTERATIELKPIRAKKAELVTKIEKARAELSKIEQIIYIEENKTANKLHTAASIVSKQFDALEFQGKWKTLLGKPERGFTAIVYGEKFSGKSTFALSFLHYLSRFGKCIFFSVEEGVKMTLQNKLKELGITGNSIMFSDEQLPEAILAAAKKFDFAVIDSLTTAGITADDLRNAKLRGEKTSYIGINHITTDGRAKGGTGQEHNPDIVVKIEPVGRAIIEKNRYHEE